MEILGMRSIILPCIIMIFLIALPVLAASVEEFQAIGSGTLTNYSCQSNGVCIGTDEGSILGNLIGKGTFTHTGTILWNEGFPNGSGGYCAPASGIVTITAADQSTLTARRVGIACQVNDLNGNYVATTFNSTYFIIEGTKRFAGATGSGVAACSAASDGNVLATVHGTITK